MLKWLIGNPLLGGISVVAALAVTALTIQSVRLHFEKKENAVLTIRVEEYQASLKNQKETSKRRESAIMRDVARERERNAELQDLLEKIEQDNDAPLPDVIGNAIDRLHE